MALKTPSTNLHKQSAEQVKTVTKKLVKRLVEKGVLLPPNSRTEPPRTEETEQERFNGILDCRPRNTYRAFRVVEGGKPDASDSSDDPSARGKP
jgi:hypothetical protein